MSNPLREWRARQTPPVTQVVVAEATGIDQALVSKYERDGLDPGKKRIRPNRRNAVKLQAFTATRTDGKDVIRVEDWDDDLVAEPDVDLGAEGATATDVA